MTTHPQLTENNLVTEEYARLASEYDTRWSFYVEATTRETMARIPLKPTCRILDVGCGTGALLYEVASSCPRAQLFGVDPVPEMLTVARSRLPESVDLRGGWAEKLPFGDEQFDVVVSCNVFHYVRQPAQALREMRRVLRGGGTLAITDWCDDYWVCRMCRLYLRLFKSVQVNVYRQQQCLDLLEEAGHEQVTIERYKINWLWGLMTATTTKEVA